MYLNYILEEALSKTESEKTFPFLVRTVAVTRPKRSHIGFASIIYAVLVRRWWEISMG
jgi:hypothetical protein